MNEISKKALSKHAEFRPLIKKHGLPETPDKTRPFHALVRAIVYQQISGSAAASILTRFKKLFGGKLPTPQALAAMPAERLRTAGISPQKAKYLHDLALHFSNGSIDEKKLSRMTNEELITALTQVKGVGVWTVQMFLLFTLRRPDVLPTLDLGIKKGFQVVYGLRALPSHERMEQLARPWRMHASLASWYLWRAADEARLASGKKNKS